MQTSIQTESTFLKRSHFLKAQGHIVHRYLDQKPVFGVFLELQAIEQCLGFLQEAKGSLVLLMRNKVDGRVVELVQDDGNLVLIQV